MRDYIVPAVQALMVAVAILFGFVVVAVAVERGLMRIGDAMARALADAARADASDDEGERWKHG